MISKFKKVTLRPLYKRTYIIGKNQIQIVFDPLLVFTRFETL